MKDGEDSKRIQRLRREDIIDTSPEDAFTRVTDLAAHLFNVPISLVADVPTTLVSFINADPQWESFTRAEAPDASFGASFCARAVFSEDIVVIEDATADERLADHPHVTGDPGIRFFAGAPLITSEGRRLGTLCVMDTEPRSVSERTLRQLDHLAQITVDELEHQRIMVAASDDADTPADSSTDKEVCFRQLLQDSPLPMCVYDLTTHRFLAVNAAAIDQYGYSAEEFRSMRITDLHVGEPAFRGGEDRAGTWMQTHRLQGGRQIEVEVNTHTIDFKGHDAALAVVRDVSSEHERHAERAERQRRLHRHHRMFAQLAERAREAWGDLDRVLHAITEVASSALNVGRVNVWRYENDPRRIVCLDNYERAADAHDRGDVLTEDVCPAYFRTLTDSRVIAVENAREDDRTAGLDRPYLREHDIVSLLDAPIRVGDRTVGVLCFEQQGEPRQWTPDEEILAGSMADFVALALESAERREAESALRESEERLEMALSAANLGCWDWNVQTDHVVFDEGWAQMLGYDLDDIDPHIDSWKERIHPDDEEQVQRALQSHLAGDTPFYEMEHRLRAHDGSWRWILSRGRVVERDDEGNPVRTVGTHLDITDRKERESVVQRFGRLLDASATEMYVFQADTLQFVQVNRGARKHLGYDEDELLSMTLMDITSLDRSQVEERLEPLREGVQRMITFETTQRRKDGSTYPVQVQIQLSRQETPPVFVAVVLDVTERREAEEALRESRRRYQLLAEHASDLVMLHDDSGEITWVSPSVQDILHRPPEEIRAGSFDSLIHPADVQDVRAHFKQLLVGEDPGPIAYRAARPDDTYIWLETLGEAVFDDEDELTHVVTSSRDVTARKRAQNELKREREFLQKLFDAIPVMITIYDPQQNGFRVNKEFERVLGWTTEDAEETNLMEAFYPDPRYHGEAAHFMDVPGSGWDDFVVQTKDDDEVYCSWSNIRLSDDTQVGIGIDLTERKQLEAQLRQAQKMETIGTLVGGIAHDFNNILHAAIVYLQMAMEDLPSESTAETFLEETEEGLHDAANLVAKLLTFSRQEGKAVEVPVDLAEIAHESIDLVEPSLPPDVEVRTKLEENCIVPGDPSQLRQVAMNIMTNAAQAMEEYGPEQENVLDIDVRTTEVDEDLASRYLNLTPGRYVRLSISDTGPGMDPETKDRIFEPFFTTKEGGRGTGLGLSVVHGIVQAHEGEITVFTEPGEGTTFNVYFPRTAPDESPPSDEGSAVAQPSERTEPGMSGHILFIDDDDQVIELETVRLQRLGYEVTTQKSAQAALEAIEAASETYDLVLTDYAMPGKSGLELARELRQRGYDIPIVLMSGFSAQVSEEEARDAGVEAFLRKPVGSSELEEVLSNQLQR